MKFRMIAAATVALAAGPALAQDHLGPGDPAAGEQVFRQCQSCHRVENPEGEILAGRNMQTGPNLYGVIGRQAGSVEGFRYRDSIVEAGEEGLVWDAEALIPYLQDPNTFLREYLDDNGARSGMAFRVRTEEDAANVVAYIGSLAPPPSADAEEEATN